MISPRASFDASRRAPNAGELANASRFYMTRGVKRAAKKWGRAVCSHSARI
jgi:hypothetical protein